MSEEREIPSHLVHDFHTVMEKTEAEAWNLKQYKKSFQKQLNELEVEKEMLELKLKHKVKEMNELRMQLLDKEEHCDKLEQEKRSLERHLETEVIKSYCLGKQVDDLALSKKKLQIEFDHLLFDRD